MTEGEALAEMAPYDAIVLDLMLPKKDGVAVCRDLRKHRVTTRLPPWRSRRGPRP